MSSVARYSLSRLPEVLLPFSSAYHSPATAILQRLPFPSDSHSPATTFPVAFTSSPAGPFADSVPAHHYFDDADPENGTQSFTMGDFGSLHPSYELTKYSIDTISTCPWSLKTDSFPVINIPQLHPDEKITDRLITPFTMTTFFFRRSVERAFQLVFAIKRPIQMRCLLQVAPTASHEYLCCLLRVPATDPGLLGFAACLKKHLRYCVVGCFTTAESLSGCHSLPQHDNQSSNDPKIGGGGVYIIHIQRNNFLQKAPCAKDKRRSNDTFGNRFEVH